jgi:predicted DNA-binding antitoxin AbrB/MazE fold protein
MVRHVDAIFIHGAFRPLQPLTMPDGTRVHLSVEEEGVEEGTALSHVNSAAKICTPRLARSKDAVDFVLEVRGDDDTSV